MKWDPTGRTASRKSRFDARSAGERTAMLSNGKRQALKLSDVAMICIAEKGEQGRGPGHDDAIWKSVFVSFDAREHCARVPWPLD